MGWLIEKFGRRDFVKSFGLALPLLCAWRRLCGWKRYIFSQQI
jgi:hypothetical protein